MRGDLGAGMEIGLGLGRVSQSYASDVSMAYDNARQVYVGEMVSRGGLYRVEGPNPGSISMQMDEILRYEYSEMVREVTTKRQQQFGTGRQIIVNGTRAKTTHHREGGVPVITIKASEHREQHGLGVQNLMDLTEIIMATISALQGQWLDTAFSAMSMAMQDYMSHSHEPHEEELFAVSFGGILITAKTRALLRKKLQLQKNKRIQLIMNHMRSHDKQRKKDQDIDQNLGKDIAERLFEKREKARIKWQDQLSPQGQETGWRSRSLNLRLDIKHKREKAQNLWTARV